VTWVAAAFTCSPASSFFWRRRAHVCVTRILSDSAVALTARSNPSWILANGKTVRHDIHDRQFSSSTQDRPLLLGCPRPRCSCPGFLFRRSPRRRQETQFGLRGSFAANKSTPSPRSCRCQSVHHHRWMRHGYQDGIGTATLRPGLDLFHKLTITGVKGLQRS